MSAAGASEETSLVELRSVRKSFGDNVVLDGIDLSSGRGEVVVIAGPSGSEMRRARTVTATSGNPFTGGGIEAPILEVFVFVGLLFIVVDYTLSRLSRRLEIREEKRSGAAPKVDVRGLEEQVA